MIVWQEPDPEWEEITGVIIGGEIIDLKRGENIEGLCNGSTRDFDSLGAGSTPAPSTTNKKLRGAGSTPQKRRRAHE